MMAGSSPLHKGNASILGSVSDAFDRATEWSDPVERSAHRSLTRSHRTTRLRGERIPSLARPISTQSKRASVNLLPLSTLSVWWVARSLLGALSTTLRKALLPALQPKRCHPIRLAGELSVPRGRG